MTIKIGQKWTNTYFNGNKVYIFGFGLGLFFILLNIVFPIKNGYIDTSINSTENVRCYLEPNEYAAFIDAWAYVNFLYKISINNNNVQ